MEDSMTVKHLCLLVFLVLMPGLALRASTVSLLVIETGRGGTESPGESSLQWENRLLDACFEAGHIVSNAPVLRLGKKSAGDIPNEAKADFDEAVKGGMEYFIIALLDYRGADGNFTLDRVSLRLFKTLPYRKILELPVSPPEPQNGEGENTQKAVWSLISHIKG
jgi:hypothetical protein